MRLYILLYYQTKAFVGPDEIFRCEPEEAQEKVVEALKACRFFRSLYERKKARLADYYTDLPNREVRLWDFDSKLIFTRYDVFVGRLATLEVRGGHFFKVEFLELVLFGDGQEYFDTVMEFSKLEKVDFTGIKASTFLSSIQQVFAEFQDQVTSFTQSTYDPLDPASTVSKKKRRAKILVHVMHLLSQPYSGVV